MAEKFEKGDHVEWNSHGGKQSAKGKAEGVVRKKLTRATTIKGHEAKATPSDPQYLVESENGGTAAHRPSALRHKNN